MHRIDESSALFGTTPESNEENEVEINVFLRGVDDTDAPTHLRAPPLRVARRSCTATRHVDILTVAPDGLLALDQRDFESRRAVVLTMGTEHPRDSVDSRSSARSPCSEALGDRTLDVSRRVFPREGRQERGGDRSARGGARRARRVDGRRKASRGSVATPGTIRASPADVNAPRMQAPGGVARGREGAEEAGDATTCSCSTA
jgi:hypothetical protein